MSKLISDNDYKEFFRIIGELSAFKGAMAAVVSERDYLRKLLENRIAADKPHGEICPQCNGKGTVMQYDSGTSLKPQPCECGSGK
jgi:DnaJ-class molecular chaperone